MSCNYCNKPKEFEEQANKSLIKKYFKNDVSVALEIDRGKLYLSAENFLIYKNTNWKQIDGAGCLTSKEINYCPMCGRKLGSDKEQEIERLNNIIKEVREYIVTHKLYCFKYDNEELFEIVTDKKAKDKLLEILERENNNARNI